MEKAVWFLMVLLMVIQYVFQTSSGLECGRVEKRSKAVLLEWPEFPEGKHPDFYVVSYQLTSDFIRKNVKSVAATQVNAQNFTILLEEENKYDVMIQSLKDGKILHAISFKTCGISDNRVKTLVTSTSVSFNWGVLSHDFSVRILHNNVSQIPKHNEGFYEWTDLRPATLYSFTLEFKQLHLEFINVSQTLNVQVETGVYYHFSWLLFLVRKLMGKDHFDSALNGNSSKEKEAQQEATVLVLALGGGSRSCSDGWTAFKQNCYKISTESKPWSVAQQNCGLFSSGAHLVDIRSKEEHAFLLSYLQSLDQIIMLWTGLNDIKASMEEGHQSWTDESPYLGKSELFSLSMIPENETDCYAFQRNPAGPEYFFIGFFCYISLPYICEYELPSVPENFTIKVQDVDTTEAALLWSSLNGWLNSGFQLMMRYYFELSEQHFETFPLYSTRTKILRLCPGHFYRFLISARSPEGAQVSLHPVVTVETRPLPLHNVTATRVSSSEIVLQWDPPMSSSNASFQYHLLSILDSKTKKWMSFPVKKSNTSAVVGNLKPYHQYQLHLQSVAEKGTVSCYEDPLVVITDVSPPTNLSIHPLDTGEDHVILYWKLPQEGHGSYVQVKPSAAIAESMKFFLNNTERFKIEFLIPGMTYEIGVASVTNGNRSDLKTIHCTLSLAVPLNVKEGKVTDTSIQIIWDQAEGNFQQYEVTCTNCASIFMIQKVTKEMVEFSNLIPGMQYNFTVKTEKEGYKDSLPENIQIETVPASVKYANVCKDSGSISLTWPPAEGIFDGYIISLVYKNFRKEESLSSDVRKFKFDGLSSGFDYFVEIVTANKLKRSLPITLIISTYPDPPSDLQAFGIEENTVYLSWEFPGGGFDNFELFYHLATSNETLLTITVYDTRAVVKNLTPGTEYLFQVRTNKGKDVSVAVEKKVITKPMGICGLTLNVVNTSSATLIWNQSKTNFTHYKASLSNKTFTEEFTITGTSTYFVIRNLTAGGIYNFTLQRVKDSVEGLIAFIEIIAEPEKPQKLKVFNVSSHFFSVHWRVPNGYVERFHVDLTPPRGFVSIQELGDGEYQADISSTIPGTMYNVTVYSVTSSTYSSPVSKTVTTNVTILNKTEYAILQFTIYKTVLYADPGPPVFLAGERVGSAGILLSWNTPPHPNGRIISYIVKYKEVCPWMQNIYTQVTTKPDSLEVLLTNLNPGTTYEIQVAAENSAGIGIFSDPFLFQTAESAPGKVVNLTVEAFNHSAVNLIWFLPRQPNGKITNFKISVKHARSGIVVKDVSVKVEDILSGRLPECNDNSESFLWSTTTPSTTSSKTTIFIPSTVASSKMSSVWNEPISFVVTNLRPYTTYLFEVSAVTTEAGYIDSAIVRTPESVPEDPPQNFVKVNITGKSFSVSWEPPTIVTGKFSYRVELYGPSGRILDNSTKDLKFTFNNLIPFTTYDVFVAAETSAGVGPKSNLTVFTPAGVPGSVFDLHAAEVAATFISVAWKKPQQPNGIITQYRVKVLVEDTGETLEDTILTEKSKVFTEPVDSDMLDESTLTSFTWSKIETVTGLYEGSAEMYALEDTFSPVKFTSVIGDNLPSLNGITELHSDTAEQLSYLVKGLLPFTKYAIAVSAFTIIGEGPPAILIARTSEQDLRKYTNYKMRVAASTTVGESALSEDNDIFVRTPEDEPESPPQNVEVLNVTATEISLKWLPPEKPNGIITHYEVLYGSVKAFGCKNTTTTSLLLHGLKPYTLYNISVRAFTHLGHGNQSSAPLSVRTAETVPDLPPENITYRNISSSEIEISFLPPPVPNGIIEYYTIYLRETDGTEKRIINTTHLSLIITGLKIYTKYAVEVSSSTVKGEGARSATLSILTDEDAPSSPPQLLTVKQLSGVSVKLSWKPPLEPNGIILYYTVYVCCEQENSQICFTYYPHIYTRATEIDYICKRDAIFSRNIMSRRSINVTDTFLEITDLENNSEYSIYVTASTKFGDGNMKSNMTSFRTSEGAPSDPPKNVWYTNLTSSSIRIIWNPPQKPNGVIKFYSIYYKNDSDTYIKNFTSNHIDNGVDNTTLSTVLNNLAKWSHYTIWLTANTASGNGNQTSEIIQVYTDEDIPDGPIEQLTYQNITSTTVNISWMPPSQPNGIVFYHVSLTMQDVQTDRDVLSLTLYETNVIFDKLKKYTRYLLKICPATEKGQSEMHISSLHITTEEDVPESAPIMRLYKNLSSTSVMLSWDPPVQPNGIILSYDLKLHGPHVNESLTTTNNSIILEDLSPSTLYSFFASARTVKGVGPYVLLMFSTDESVPDAPPENVTVVVTSPYRINISWSEPVIITGPTFYLIDITSVDTDDYKASFVKTNDENKTLDVSGLRAFTRYSVVVTAFTGDLHAAHIDGKSSTPVIVSTFEAVPRDPLNNITFQKIPDEVTKFQVTFVPPSELSGNTQVYQAIVYKEDDPTFFQICNLSVIDRTNKSVTAMLEGLKGGYTYNISVYAINSAGAGPKIQLKITTDIKEPPRPSKKPMPVYDTSGTLLVTATTITIHMPVCYYNDDHGPIKKIQILVSEAGVQNDGNVTKWYDAYFKKPRPYFVNEGFPNPLCGEGNDGLSSKEDVYVIGADSTCVIPGNEEKICNGPLKPRKQYLFKFRATNIKGQFTDSDYSDPIKTLGDGLSERAVEIILAVTLCILSIILLVAVIYVFARIRQKQKEGGTYSPRDAEIIDTKFKLDQLITVADLEMTDERFTR
ncbi:hypothetical protein lerEdw1_020955 [Lerista edwardsae]|nr:hypothetical protein lerEdw1_020955 [Lerista edwardsae]